MSEEKEKKFPRRIVAFGSSSVHGKGDLKMGGFINRFRLWHETHNPKNSTYNLGIFGETTESLLERIPSEAAARKPHLIILYPGLNDTRRVGSKDASNEVSPDNFSSSIGKVIDACQAVAPTLVLSAFPFDEEKTTPYQGSDWFYLLDDAEKYTELLRNICKEKETLFLDILAKWKTMDMEKFLADDGLHCNELGHQRLALTLQQFLNQEFREDNSSPKESSS